MRFLLNPLNPFTRLALVTAAGIASYSYGLQVGKNEKAPQAEKKPQELVAHGDVRVDPYFWLKNRDDPKVISYLEEENVYAGSILASAKPLADQLEQEFKSRLPAVVTSAPYLENGYLYYSQSFANKDYDVYLRRPNTQNGDKPAANSDGEEVLLDENQLASGMSYFDLGKLKVSPDNRYLAYSFDSVGRRLYTIQVIERITRKPVLKIENASGSFEWASNALFYTTADQETLRDYQVYRQPLPQSGSTSVEKPQLVYEELDETFTLGISKSLTGDYLFFRSESTLTDEWRYLKTEGELDSLKVFEPRKRGLKYSVADGGDRFFVLSDYEAENYQLLQASKEDTSLASWQTVLAHDSEAYREEFKVFKSHIVVREKRRGQDLLRLIDRKSGASSFVPFKEDVYVASLYSNGDYVTDSVLYQYESPTTPHSVYKFNLTSGESTLVKQDEVVGFDSNLYKTERLWVKARDGVLVPMSVTYRKGLIKNGNNPTLVYGYGSYGITIDPTFSSQVISLLDRGFVYAIAHVRGGAMLGRSWYQSGKLLAKKNTFNDFVDCSRYLVDTQWTNPKVLYAQGGSAGGLLMGAVVNQSPELYRGVIANVPFVDVVTSMLDESIPLTTGEYDEWGDPRQKEYYSYMLSYSPYDNVRQVAYPNILVTTGLHDSQVQYWEPAKWVAKLRDYNQGNSLILLRTNMEAGHGGASGQLQGLREAAEEWSFILKLQSTQDPKGKLGLQR